MTCWKSKGVLTAAFHPRTGGSAQQLRAFAAVILALADRGSGPSASPWRPYPAALAAAPARSYSRRGKNGGPDVPPPSHRGRTAYYDILDVTPAATQAQIKTAYYKQSFRFHPDKNAGSTDATTRFAQVREAYNVLGSVALRRKYDRGTLSLAEARDAGRPSSKEAGAGVGSSQPRTGRHYVGGKAVFDFDAFYQAHYGEQLARERRMRARREELRRLEEEMREKEKRMAVTVGVLMVIGVLVVGVVSSRRT